MLSRRDLERLAPTITHGNVGHAETLYLQDVVLSTVSRETADQLVFKRGTALAKFFQLDRLSEDLDFTARRPIDGRAVVELAVRDLENYGAAVAEREVDDGEASFHARLGIEGPLYTGDRRSLSFLRIEVNERSSASRVQIRRYTPPFPDVPSFELAVLAAAEILAEKIRAIVTRSQPRDLYDVYHLVETSVRVEPALVQEKLDYDDLAYEPTGVLDAARDLETSWPVLTQLTYADPPPFDDAIAALERALDEGG